MNELMSQLRDVVLVHLHLACWILKSHVRIGTRLRTLGWDREVDYLQEQHFRPLKAIKSIWVSKTLTDRGRCSVLCIILTQAY